MSDFQEYRGKRRGQSKAPERLADEQQLEQKIARALVNIQEHEDNLRTAWGELYKDLIGSIKKFLHVGRVSVSPETCHVDSITSALQKVELDLDAAPGPATGDATNGSSVTKQERTEILCLGLGKPATDKTAQHQLALLLLIADSLETPRQSIEAYDPMWDQADVGLIRRLGLTPSARNEQGIHQLNMNDNPCLIYMPHCPRPLYEAILTSNWSRLRQPSSRWLLLGNELLDYIPHAVTTRALDSSSNDDMTVVGKGRRNRKGRNGRGAQSAMKTDGVLERIAPHLQCYALPPSPSGMEHSFASLQFQCLPRDSALRVNWEDLPIKADDIGDSRGEVITSELAFDV